MKKLAMLLLFAPLALCGGCSARGGAYTYYDPSFDDGRHGYEPPITHYTGNPTRAFQQPPQAVYPQPSFPQPANPARPQAMYIYPQSVYVYPPSPQPVNLPPSVPQPVYPQPVYPQPGAPQTDLPGTDPQMTYPRPAYP